MMNDTKQEQRRRRSLVVRWAAIVGAIVVSATAITTSAAYISAGSVKSELSSRELVDAPFVELEASDTQVMALTSEGGVWAWGGSQDVAVPTELGFFRDKTVVDISAGTGAISMAVTSGGDVYA